ncbi:hypothetical protein RD792_007511 [Penstemon davidsonii]|uniref:NAC domain-containing protein n=1 Tax=Penstemon davidsonii TaxID=160366 RepID=A0ABR0D6T3_9LAMI|nr:hypothetical protein RD792_007511 [Penstemon davidsonii]
MGSRVITTSNEEKEKEDDVPLPGFRFHPTDEELVGFYLRRKVEKRPISIELIKQADIYKFDPWDLPKSSISVGDKEWYFFCKRGRKYRNSIRPNRVTGSGFWKATGIDKPIYSSSGREEGVRECIGLKKSLVYYRGSAGKGTKTDWMMHEFRLPVGQDKTNTKHMDTKTIAQEAEVWTLCRILKRNISYRKCVPNWSETNPNQVAETSSKSCSIDSSEQNRQRCNYISFSPPEMWEKKPYSSNVDEGIASQQFIGGHFSSSSVISQGATSVTSSSFASSICGDINELLKHADWEDLRSIAEYSAVNPFYS